MASFEFLSLHVLTCLIVKPPRSKYYVTILQSRKLQLSKVKQMGLVSGKMGLEPQVDLLPPYHTVF